MTRSKITFMSLALLALASLLVTQLSMAENKGRAEISLDGGKSGPVDFNHHLHQAVVKDCQVCHADFAQEEGALDAAKAAGTLKAKQVMNKTCLTCHRAKKKAGEKSGPVSCKDCHQK